MLLALTDSLPGEFSRYRIRLLLIAGATETYRAIEQRIQELAKHAGCDDKRTAGRFHVQIHHCLTELLKPEHGKSPVRPAPLSISSQYPEDDYTEGAMVVSIADRKPDCGVLARLEQRCWDAVLHRWHKTLLVRFPDGERRISIYTGLADAKRSCRQPSLLVLLPAAEVRNVL